MGISGISPGSLLLILLILVFVMGGSRLRTLGEDLGVAYKSFKKAFQDDHEPQENQEASKADSQKIS